MSEKIDVQNSIFNGINYNEMEEFMVDLREVLKKHNIISVRSDFMEIKNDTLVVRGSEFISKKAVPMSSDNREDDGTNIIYNNEIKKINKYKEAFVRVNEENKKYKEFVEAFRNVLEIE